LGTVRAKSVKAGRVSNWRREMHYRWRAVDHEGEILESFVTKRRDRKAALKLLRKTMKRHGRAHIFVTDNLRSNGAAMKVIGNVDKQETGRWLNNRAENSQVRFQSARSIN
jgi:putative transposase